MTNKTIFLFLFLSLICFHNTLWAEEIDGPANVRLIPKGDVVITLNDGIPVHIITPEGDWVHISFESIVEKSVLTADNTIPINTILKDTQGNEIGKTLAIIKVMSSSEKDNKLLIKINAYTFKDNIKQNLIIEEYRIAKNTEELFKAGECFSLACVPDEILVKRKEWRRMSSLGKREPETTEASHSTPVLSYLDTGSTLKYHFAGLEVEKKPIEIHLGGKSIYRGALTDYPFDESVKGLYVSDNHWVFEFMEPDIKDGKISNYYGTVILDGVNLNRKYDYKEVFNFIFIKNKPFYFFSEKSGTTKMHYAGNKLPIRFDSILHYACCSDAAFNPDWNNNMVWFYAMRDGALYYVEVGAY